jgi:GntR family transcriptional regulator, regulator for abcA and norABC
MWKPDLNSQTPLFRQIATYFEQEITEGKRQPGSQLPPERKLAQDLGVNRSTITSAYAELRATGLIESRPGSGYKVSETMWGVKTKQIPNWKRYAEGGVFLPSAPLQSRIRQVMRQPGMVNLASGEANESLYPSKLLADAMSKIPVESCLSYPEPLGLPALRTELSHYLRKNLQISASEDEILITAGAQQALHLLTQCLLNPGDTVGIEGPSYFYSLPLFQSVGLRILRIPMDKDGLIPSEITKLYHRQRIKMVFTNPTLQNPTCVTLSLDRRHELIDICQKLGIPIVEDDPYNDLFFDSRKILPIKAFDNKHTVLYIGSLSKTVAPGLRIGWIVGPKNIVERLADAKQQMDFGTSTIIQYLAAEYLKSEKREQHLKKVRAELKHRRDMMLRHLDGLSKFMDYIKPNGSFNIWCRLKTPVSDSDLLEACITQGVVIRPGGVFGAGPGYFRLTYANCTSTMIDQGLSRLQFALNEVMTNG